METKNAVVKSVYLGIEDHGFLTVFLNLEYDGSICQSFGGYPLQSNSWPKNTANVAGWFIRRILEICGVKKWADLPGKTVRVRVSQEKVEAIGHIVKEDWFFPEKMMEASGDG